MSRGRQRLEYQRRIATQYKTAKESQEHAYQDHTNTKTQSNNHQSRFDVVARLQRVIPGVELLGDVGAETNHQHEYN
jgi:hypothetical protein